MVEYTLVLELGQSNASPIGDIQGWEDNHPELAIRSPNTDRAKVRQFSNGAYGDSFTLAATFKGGPQTNLFGTEINGQWQTVNLRGVAYDPVRVATFYNPSATLQTFSAYARSYPGTYNVVASSNIAKPNTPTEFSTNLLIQPGGEQVAIDDNNGSSGATGLAVTSGTLSVDDIVVFPTGVSLPSGFTARGPYRVNSINGNVFTLQTWPEGVSQLTTGSGWQPTSFRVVFNLVTNPLKITRRRDGVEYTCAPTGLGQNGGARLLVDPPFSPAPLDGEEFTLPLRLQQAQGSTDDPLVFEPCFGGLVGAVSLYKPAIQLFDANGRGLVRSPGWPLRKERAILIDQTTPYTNGAPSPGLNQLFFYATAGTELINGGETTLVVGQTYEVVSTPNFDFPSELTANARYYVVSIGTDSEGSQTFELSESFNGTPISFAEPPNIGSGTLGGGFVFNHNETFTAPTTVWPVSQPEQQINPLATAVQDPAFTDRIAFATNPFIALGEKIRLSYAGTPLPALPAGDYYVVETTSSTIKVATEIDGTAVSFTWPQVTTTNLPLIERLDAPFLWYISDEKNGLPSDIGTFLNDVQGNVVRSEVYDAIVEQNPFAGSVAGLRLRCTAGVNLNDWRYGKHISYDNGNDLTQIHFDGAWDALCSANDEFVIEPTPVAGQSRPFEQFCQLLPWAPFEGLARGGSSAGLAAVTITSATNSEIVVSGMPTPDRSAIRLYTTGTLPNGLVPGKIYYVTKCAASSLFISETYKGTALQGTGAAGSGTHYAEVFDNDNGYNPFPPGFNYPSQFSVPRRYMPFDGYVQGAFYGEAVSQQAAGISAGLQLSFDLHSHTGRRSLYVPCTFGGTSLGHKEVHPTGSGTAFGWSDLNQQISWAPGKINGCFARLLDVLDGVKLALTEEGSTVSDVVVYFGQGEEDATTEYLANNYRANLKQFKVAVRQALYERGLAPSSAARIKWLQPTIKEIASWPYATTVNQAIVAEAQADAHSRAVTGSDLEVHADRDVFAGNSTADRVHYHGTQMDLLGQRAFAAFKALERDGYSDTEVCNMALSYLGEPGRLTNVDTDTSREAELCRQFLPVARDELLERHAWDFALRSITLTKRATSPRVDYKYAYDYPDNVASVLSLIRSDVDYNYKTMGTTGQHDYTVELDSNNDRVILTDLDDALMLYVAKVVDSTMWSTVFSTAVAWRIVFHLAGAILKGEEGSKKAAAASEMAERMLKTATKHDSDHKRDVDISNHVPVWLRHRSNPGHYRR